MPSPPPSEQEDLQAGKVWKPELAFHAGRGAAFAAIGLLWAITPICYAYVLWTLITLAPSLEHSRPASHGALQVIHYIFLSYCALEIPFSIYYRYLAIKANARRPSPQYSRKVLRGIFKKGLENGLDWDPDMQADDPLEAMTLGEITRVTSRELPSEALRKKNSAFSLSQFRKRHSSANGNGNSNGSTSDIPMTKLDRDAPPASAIADESTSEEEEGTPKSKYSPSFIREPLKYEDPRAADFRDTFRLWFNGCTFESLRKLDCAEWLSWSFYGQPLEELQQERKQWEKDGRPVLHIDGTEDVDDDGLSIEGDKLGFVEHAVEMVEHRAARRFKEGRNPDVKVIRLTLDPVKVASRPLLLYIFVYALQKSIIGNAKLRGFKMYHHDDTRYLMRIPVGWTPSIATQESRRPLFMLHGLGMGLAQYASMLNVLAKDAKYKDRPVIILIQPHISMSFFSSGYLKPPTMQSCTDGIEKMAKRWGFDKCGMTVLSHSNGTTVHSWLLKCKPDLCKRNCFVDPVCFCLWEPHICYNFLYANPHTPIEYLMRYFVSRELGVALMLQRTFDWSSNLLFAHQIPNLHSPYHSAFFLAGEDSILSAPRVRRYLKSHGVEEVGDEENVGASGGLKVHAGHKHGESMIGSGLAFGHVMDWVSREKESHSEAREADLP